MNSIHEIISENSQLDNCKKPAKNSRKWMYGLAILSACLGSCVTSHVKDIKSGKIIKGLRSENTQLQHDVSYFQKDSTRLALENARLRKYQNFVNSIEPFYPEGVDGKTKAEEKEIEKQNVKGQKKWDDACELLGIDSEQLFRLQKGLER